MGVAAGMAGGVGVAIGTRTGVAMGTGVGVTVGVVGVNAGLPVGASVTVVLVSGTRGLLLRLVVAGQCTGVSHYWGQQGGGPIACSQPDRGIQCPPFV